MAASNTCKYTVGIFGVDCDVELMTVEKRFEALDTNKVHRTELRFLSCAF